MANNSFSVRNIDSWEKFKTKCPWHYRGVCEAIRRRCAKGGCAVFYFLEQKKDAPS